MFSHADTMDIAIIGAGIVGINVALQLQQKGYSTILIDRSRPAEGCSSGNAGVIASYGVTPVSMPGLWKQVPKMLLDPVGPLSIRWQHLPKMVPWLFRFWRASNHSQVEGGARALASLVRHSLADYQNIARSAGLQHMVKASPILAVFKSKELFLRDQYAWDLRRENGVQWACMEGAEIQDFEPSLSGDFRFAVRMENAGYTLDPQRLAYGLYKQYLQNGGRFVCADVRSLAIREGQPQILTSTGVNAARGVVVACGAKSGVLSKALGEPVPLEAERGYHVTLTGFEGLRPRQPIMSPAHKVIATPMECGLRIAGMVEFGGFLPPNFKRSDVLYSQLKELFPKIEKGTTSHWMGHRPTLPDSLPVIGRSKRHRSVYYAFGHQHVGLTCAPATARIITDLITENKTAIDIEAFRVDRF